jgi:hypothetical protein
MKVFKTSVAIKTKAKSQILGEISERFTLELARLLKESHPNALKKHILMKLVHLEVPHYFEDEIRSMITSYYAIAFERRTAGQFQRTFGFRPYPWLLSQFILDFSNAEISETNLARIASSLKFSLCTHFDPPREIGQVDFIHLVIYRLLKARSHKGSSLFDVQDFLAEWRKTSHSRFGDRFDQYFDELGDEVASAEHIQSTSGPVPRGTAAGESAPDAELSQTDLDWLKSVLEALVSEQLPPKYPLSRGPQVKIITQIEHICRLLSKPAKAEWREQVVDVACKLCRSCLMSYNQMPSEELKQTS